MRLSPVLQVLLSCAALTSCRPAEGREQRDFERMRQQQRYDPYEASSFFHNGAVMQVPPAHTIPRPPGPSPILASNAFLTGTSGGKDVADVPATLDQTLRTAGAAQFAISCAPCHGASGNGDGSMALNMSKRPPSLRTPPASALPAGTMFKVITDGFGQMPPYGWQMPVDVRWAVVAYVRSLDSTSSSVISR